MTPVPMIAPPSSAAPGGSAHQPQREVGGSDVETFEQTFKRVSTQSEPSVRSERPASVRQEAGAEDGETPPPDQDEPVEATEGETLLLELLQAAAAGPVVAVPAQGEPRADVGEADSLQGIGCEGCLIPVELPIPALSGTLAEPGSPTALHAEGEGLSANGEMLPTAQALPSAPSDSVSKARVPPPAPAVGESAAGGVSAEPDVRPLLPNAPTGAGEMPPSRADAGEADRGAAPVLDVESAVPATVALARAGAHRDGPGAGAMEGEAGAPAEGGSVLDPALTVSGVAPRGADPSEHSFEREADVPARDFSGGQSAPDRQDGPMVGGATSFAADVQRVGGASRPAPVSPAAAVIPTPWEPARPSVRLEVAPGDGAPVQVHVSVVNQTVYTRIVTPQPEVQDYLTRQQSRLETQLQQHGLEMGSFVVDSGQQQFGRGGSEWTPPPPPSYGVRLADGQDPLDVTSASASSQDGMRRSRLHVVV